MFQRLLQRPLAAVVMLAIVLVQPVVAAASAGWVEDSRCCCPEPADCHCPGHDPRDEQEGLRKCGNTGELVTAALLTMTAPARAAASLVEQVGELQVPAPRPLCTQLCSQPETPPF